MKKFTFKKTERLTGQQEIGQLRASGRTYTTYPFRVYWMAVPEKNHAPVQVAFSVSKKRFKKAVVRNKIRRRVKEAYRKHKEVLSWVADEGEKIVVLVVYISDEVLSYSMIEEKLIIALEQLISHYEKSI
jgi:ribonuclease P protein component